MIVPFRPYLRNSHETWEAMTKLVYDPHRLEIRKYSFKIRNIELWNSLPQHVIDSESIISFEKNLDKHWGKHEIYFENFKAEFKPNKINKKWNWTKGPCQELLFKDLMLSKEGTAGVSPPYLITRRISPRGMVQLRYLPLTLLCGGSIRPRRYSRGISPLPYYMTALSMQEGTAGASPPYLTAWQTSTTAACWSQSTNRILGPWSNTYCPCPRSPAGMHQSKIILGLLHRTVSDHFPQSSHESSYWVSSCCIQYKYNVCDFFSVVFWCHDYPP